ncbi:head-tail adaptor protein [Pseudaminobacter arsenicus]|uniref:Head-tail adaptor protein n=1 Tax=Borborobacter arsenicus TaxID=1851146 RepID=A0A432VAB2_9HYPH|nr:head-tail adaptor protein [Pseudaminobacter arsenicus]RUM99033.1 head-tail adaptor protein [Pseudaminobacter arsenicus]
MPQNNRRAGALRERVNIQGWTEEPDGYGGTKQVFGTIATVAAHFHPNRGGEAVMASRLAGAQPFVVTLRSSTQTRAITPAHKLQDARNTARMFDIKAIADPDGRGAWLELLVTETVT